MTDFEQLVDLAQARMGGAVVAANDDFFAEKENLVKDEAPVWIADRYTDRGKWMDGWESRRRRTPGHDWAIVRLGLPGIVRGVVVDTAYFKGNFPEAFWLEGTVAPHDATAERLAGEHTAWTPLLPRTRLEGDTKNRFAVDVPWRFTHLRLAIDPDGGVARLRVHGEVVPAPAAVAGPAAEPPPLVDLAALEHGAAVVAASDMFFGSRHHLVLPGDSSGMHDGWETRRRRGPGHDWAVVRLAARGVIERAVVDTSHFKGNAPGTCALFVADAPGPGGVAAEAFAAEGAPWRPLLPTSPLEPHRVHTFADALLPAGPATHAKLRIDPDGGVARLRLFGRVDATGREALALAHLDALLPGDARAAFHACLGSTRWAESMAGARPFGMRARLDAAADAAMETLTEADWREAFAAHPRIGEAARTGSETERRWANQEQSRGGVAPAEVRAALAEGNRAYEAKFGFVFLICATGKTAEEMLAALTARLHNDARKEFGIAVDEQKQITRLRLGRLLST